MCGSNVMAILYSIPQVPLRAWVGFELTIPPLSMQDIIRVTHWHL